jgi:hypothetical protein
VGRPARCSLWIRSLNPSAALKGVTEPSVLHSHVQEEDEHDKHHDTPHRERPALARHALDLPAAGPDAQPGLMGAGAVPHQEPRGDRDKYNQGMKPISGGIGPGASSSPRQAAACQLTLRRVD